MALAINTNQKALISLMDTVGPIRNEFYLQQMVYIAQELGWINSNYDFDFALGFPFSAELEADLLDLEANGLVYNTNTGNSWVLTEEAQKLGVKVPRCEILKTLDSDILITMSRILHLRRSPEGRNNIVTAINNKFPTPWDEIERTKGFLSNMGACL